MEINLDLEHNPIVQDTKKKTGAPRSYGLDILWNYGCIPRTHEDPERRDPITGLLGDGDPIDVVEISGQSMATGTSTLV
jgi:inorganic pyrophosphatase